jgi:hypothetical protein
MTNHSEGTNQHTENEEGTSGFVIKDRRRFDSKGNIRNEPDRASRGYSGSTLKVDAGGSQNVVNKNRVNDLNQARKEEVRSFERSAEKHTAEDDDTGGLNFSSFIISLATQASIQLGLLRPPQGMSVDVDIEAAKQTIDIIGLIEKKTRGNLDSEEQTLISNILHELRIGYVQIVQKQK